MNRIITERCVLDVTARGLELVELIPGWTRDQVQAAELAGRDVLLLSDQ